MIVQDRDRHVSSNKKFIDKRDFLTLISILYMMNTNRENNSSLIDLCFNTNIRPFYK